MSKRLVKLSICAAIGGCLAAPLWADAGLSALTKVAKSSLASLQRYSFENGREYCGMIGRTRTGELIVSPARRGRSSGCDARRFADRSITPVASYHTHGAYNPMADAEVPSVMDLDMDISEQLFGFVATPGGRMWITDHRSKTVRQVCGIGCLPMDPAFKPGQSGVIPEELSRRAMAQRQGVGGPRHLRARNPVKTEAPTD